MNGEQWLAQHARNQKIRAKNKRNRRERQRMESTGKTRCEEYLKAFWFKYPRAASTEERILLLSQAANPPWERISPELLKSLRARYVRRSWKFLDAEILECGACVSAKADVKHHIVPIAFGGINSDINLLKICDGCHRLIHPWMSRVTGQQHNTVE